MRWSNQVYEQFASDVALAISEKLDQAPFQQFGVYLGVERGNVVGAAVELAVLAVLQERDPLGAFDATTTIDGEG